MDLRLGVNMIGLRRGGNKPRSHSFRVPAHSASNWPRRAGRLSSGRRGGDARASMTSGDSLDRGRRRR